MVENFTLIKYIFWNSDRREFVRFIIELKNIFEMKTVDPMNKKTMYTYLSKKRLYRLLCSG